MTDVAATALDTGDSSGLNRIEIVQQWLDAIGGRTYLEIGVDTGASFIPIRAARKWGVDPAYHLTCRRRAKYRLFSLIGFGAERLFRMTSDEFFRRHASLLAARKVDVCLIDGLHTYEQSLKDVEQVLPFLTPAGAIVMHDCNPATALMALPAANIEELIARGIPDWDGAWSGDVWKTIVHLRACRSDLRVFVIDCDTGVGIVTRGVPDSRLRYTARDIQSMDYAFFAARRHELLDLRSETSFRGFLAGASRLAEAHGS